MSTKFFDIYNILMEEISDKLHNLDFMKDEESFAKFLEKIYNLSCNELYLKFVPDELIEYEAEQTAVDDYNYRVLNPIDIISSEDEWITSLYETVEEEIDETFIGKSINDFKKFIEIMSAKVVESAIEWSKEHDDNVISYHGQRDVYR